MIKKLSFFFVMAGIYAAASFALTLDDALQQAIKNNPAIQSAKNQWGSARAVITKTYFLPDAELGAEFEDLPEGSADLRQAMKRYYKFSQAIPWPGRLISEGKAATARADRLKYSYFVKEREVMKDVKSAYYELGKIDQLIKILDANVELMQQAYRVAQTKYSAGEASQVEALKLQLELNRLENALQNLKDERSVQNLKLSLLLNSASDEMYVVEPLPEPSAFELAVDIEKLPRLKVEYSSLEEMRAMKGVAISAYFPETMFKWKSQKYGLLVGSNTLMFDFTVPLWFPLRQNYMLAEADKNIAAAENNYQAMKNMQLREVRDFSVAVNILHKKIRLYNSSLLVSSKAAVASALAEYKSGKVDFMLLLDSLRQYLATNVEYYEILANYNIKLAELEEIAGKN